MTELLIVIRKWFESIGLKKVLSYFSEIPLFYFKPKKFFLTFNNYSIIEVIRRMSVYFLLSYSLIFLLFTKTSIREIFSMMILGLLLSAVLLIPLCITSRIIFKKYNLKKVSLLLLGINAFFVPLFILFNIAFINTELYLFYFAQNFIFLCLLVYIIIVNSYVLSSSITQVFTASLVNILLVNLIMAPFFVTESIHHEKINFLNDPIYSEYLNKTNDLILLDEFPVERIIIKIFDLPAVYSFCSMKFDDSTCMSTKERNEVYISSLKKELKKTQELEDSNIEFSTTKKLLKNYHAFLKVSKEEIEFKYDNIPDSLDKTDLIDSSGVVIGFYCKELINNQKLFKPLIEFVFDNNNLIKNNEYARYPLFTSGIFAFPIGLTMAFFDFINGNQVSNDKMKLIRPK